MRITQYTIEGSPIFYEFSFNGNTIEYTYDNSMDGYTGQGKGRRSTSCSGISKKQVNLAVADKKYVLVGCSSEVIGNTFYFN
ncbi:DUF4362 domain-containing protein [Paenibacillus albus]|uniref:DUF4362 domain-containing protein n=1 Tax=Paenibacillus albus TaxID=2495582 RepID=A0A3Q8X6L6_9BACL|nr:DUF4362 domain-containing protein [Paenibacillus albus]